MPMSRIAGLALAADVTAVVVFAAIGRSSHAESGDLWPLLGTAAPFLVGLGAAWATPVLRAQPAGLRGGLVALAGASVLGLLIRFGFTDRLPFTFAMITVVSLAVLLLGWRTLSLVIAHRAAQRVR